MCQLLKLLKRCGDDSDIRPLSMFLHQSQTLEKTVSEMCLSQSQHGWKYQDIMEARRAQHTNWETIFLMLAVLLALLATRQSTSMKINWSTAVHKMCFQLTDSWQRFVGTCIKLSCSQSSINSKKFKRGVFEEFHKDQLQGLYALQNILRF